MISFTAKRIIVWIRPTVIWIVKGLFSIILGLNILFWIGSIYISFNPDECYDVCESGQEDNPYAFLIMAVPVILLSSAALYLVIKYLAPYKKRHHNRGRIITPI